MGLFDLFRSREESLVLDVASLERWPSRLARRARLDERLDRFRRRVEEGKSRVARAKAALTRPSLREGLEERERAVHDEWLPTLLRAVEELLDRTVVPADPFRAEEAQESFREALEEYRDLARKSVAALGEFYEEELRALDDAIRSLEDVIIGFTAQLEEARFSQLLEVKRLVEEYRATRGEEERLRRERERVAAEVELLEAKRLRIKERIRSYAERARNSRFKELLAEEEELLGEADRVREEGLSPEEEEEALRPLRERLRFLRKKMIHDVTALNITEQRSFLEGVKEGLREKRRFLAEIDARLGDLSFEAFRPRFQEALAPFNVRIEEATRILEPRDEDVAPQ